MANHGPLYGLSKDCRIKATKKFNIKQVREVILWIEAVLGRKLHDDLDSLWSEQEAAAIFKDGVVLCELMNAIEPNAIKRINRHDAAFKQMENIEMFTKACLDYGLRQTDLFQIADLFEVKAVYTVFICLHALGSLAKKKGFQGPNYGVRLSNKLERHFSTEQIAKGNMIIPKQAGTNDVPSQAGMSPYGLSRQVVPTDKESAQLSPTSSSIISLQYGTNSKSTQKGMTPYGLSRQILPATPSDEHSSIVEEQRQERKSSTSSHISDHGESDKEMFEEIEDNFDATGGSLLSNDITDTDTVVAENSSKDFTDTVDEDNSNKYANSGAETTTDQELEPVTECLENGNVEENVTNRVETEEIDLPSLEVELEDGKYDKEIGSSEIVPTPTEDADSKSSTESEDHLEKCDDKHSNTDDDGGDEMEERNNTINEQLTTPTCRDNDINDNGTEENGDQEKAHPIIETETEIETSINVNDNDNIDGENHVNHQTGDVDVEESNNTKSETQTQSMSIIGEENKENGNGDTERDNSFDQQEKAENVDVESESINEDCNNNDPELVVVIKQSDEKMARLLDEDIKHNNDNNISVDKNNNNDNDEDNAKANENGNGLDALNCDLIRTT